MRLRRSPSVVDLNLEYDAIFPALESFPGLPHRMERIREKDGVLFVNDSKATNAEAAAPALAAFPRVRWIVGGQAKAETLGDTAAHLDHVVKAYTIGEAGPMFARLLRAAGVAVDRDAKRLKMRRNALRRIPKAARPSYSPRPARRSTSFATSRRAETAFRELVEGAMNMATQSASLAGKIKATRSAGRSRSLRPLRPLGAGPLVLGNRPGPAAADRGADRHRPDRGRRRQPGRRRSAIRAAREGQRAVLLLPPADVDRGVGAGDDPDLDDAARAREALLDRRRG